MASPHERQCWWAVSGLTLNLQRGRGGGLSGRVDGADRVLAGHVRCDVTQHQTDPVVHVQDAHEAREGETQVVVEQRHLCEAIQISGQRKSSAIRR